MSRRSDHMWGRTFFLKCRIGIRRSAFVAIDAAEDDAGRRVALGGALSAVAAIGA